MGHKRHRPYGQLGVGIFLLIIGIVLLFNNFDIMDHIAVWKLWPLIIIFIGIGKFMEAGDTEEYLKAAWWVSLGCWFLVTELHLFGLNYFNSWPILLILVGVEILWKSFISSNEIAKDHSNGK